MKIPKSYDSLTIGQFIKIRSIIKSDIEDVDKDSNILSISTNRPVEYFDQIDFKSFGKLIRKISWLYKPYKGKIKRYVWFNWRLWKFVNNADQLNTSQYLALKHYEDKVGSESNLHLGLSELMRPVKLFKKKDKEGKPIELSMEDRQKNAQLFYDKLPIGKIYGTLFFYSDVYEKLNPIMSIYLQQIRQALRIEQIQVEVDTLSCGNTMGGTT